VGTDPYSVGQNVRLAPATMTVRRGQKVLWTATTPGLVCVTSSVFSPDGRSLLNIANGCGYAQLWDVNTGQRLQTFLGRDDRGLFATFTPDSRRVVLSFSKAVDRFDRPLPALWSVETKQQIALLIAPDAGPFTKVQFSADGRYMIFTNGGGPVSVFNALTGAYKQTFPNYGGHGAADARLSPDGRLALVLYYDGALVVYRVAGGTMIKLLRPGQGKYVGSPVPIGNLKWY
jgi:WD40 repeat protein